MPYELSQFEEKIRAARREFPLPIGGLIEEGYRTEEHKKRLIDFFSPYVEVLSFPVPLSQVYVFRALVSNEENLAALQVAYGRPENADIRTSFKTMSVGRQTAVAASPQTHDTLQDKLY